MRIKRCESDRLVQMIGRLLAPIIAHCASNGRGVNGIDVLVYIGQTSIISRDRLRTLKENKIEPDQSLENVPHSRYSRKLCLFQTPLTMFIYAQVSLQALVGAPKSTLCLLDKVQSKAIRLINNPNLTKSLQTLSHKSSFIRRTCNLWNVLPSSCFPESYSLPSFKSKINKLDLISLSS